jgi:hypothetical protein
MKFRAKITIAAIGLLIATTAYATNIQFCPLLGHRDCSTNRSMLLNARATGRQGSVTAPREIGMNCSHDLRALPDGGRNALD